MVENFFSQGHIQAYIHDCLVGVRKGRKTHWFWVFFKNHRHLRINGFVGESDLRGDIIVMRAGAGASRNFVNLRGGDGVLADRAVRRLVFKHKRFNKV